MQFNATSLNMTALLLVALAVVCVVVMLRRRYDSNLPLLFYVVALLFSNMSDRTVNPYLLYVGLILTLVLRFEFMGSGFAKFVAYCAMGSLCLIIWTMMADVLA
jgi:hypothetical protein